MPLELVAVWIFVALLASRGCECELPYLRCGINDVALVAGHGPVRALQWIGLVVPREADIGGNEVLATVALKATGIFFHKLPAMRIVMASPALIGLAHRVGEAFGIVELRLVAAFAFKIGMGRIQCKAEKSMPHRIDSTLS